MKKCVVGGRDEEGVSSTGAGRTVAAVREVEKDGCAGGTRLKLMKIAGQKKKN